MKVLFIRTENKGPFSVFNPVRAEPLEIEYLAAVLNQLGHDYRIYDPIAKKENINDVLKTYQPDVVGIAGYINSLDIMLNHARRVKRFNKDIKVLVGGPNAEVNHTMYYIPQIDIIVHSNGWETFKNIIERNADLDACQDLEGICIRNNQNEWVYNKRVPLNLVDMPKPDRSHFYKYKHRFTYVHHGTTAMMKTSYGCPHLCSFCYAKMLNDGKYSYRDLDDVIDEIESINCDQILITDDTFLITREHAIAFCEKIKARRIRKKFVMYSRADFIVENKDVIKMLKDIGTFELLIGIESIEEETLKAFNKANTTFENNRCIDILHETGMGFAPLFIMNIDSKVKDFRKLWKWMWKMKVNHFTLSIFTPIPGTKEFVHFKDKLITKNTRKWDLLHFVIEPIHLSKPRFYFELYLIYFLGVITTPNLMRLGFERFVLLR